MTIEERVRRVLAEAVADEPPLRGAPLDHALRRRSRRPVVAGAVAMVVVLAAVVALAVVRGPDERLLPSTVPTVPTEGWRTYTDVAGNFRFRYPPNWRLHTGGGRGGRGPVTLVPPGIAGAAKQPATFSVWVETAAWFWIGEDWQGTTSLGRLPGGQPYLRNVSDPADTGFRYASWMIDWGRPCLTGGARCVPHSVRIGIQAADGRLWDRHRAVAETIPTTLEQLRPAAPTAGDRGLPNCQPDQWRLVWVEEYGLRHGYQGGDRPGRRPLPAGATLPPAADPAPGGGGHRRPGAAREGQPGDHYRGGRPASRRHPAGQRVVGHRRRDDVALRLGRVVQPRPAPGHPAGNRRRRRQPHRAGDGPRAR
jgi:hypothetical protein